MAERLAGGQSASKPTAPGRRSVSADRPARRQSARRQFDVFLSHNGADKPFVESVARELRRQGLEPWLDRWYLVPGREWMDDLPAALEASSNCAVFIGKHGLGDWEQLELKLAEQRATRDRGFGLIPVLLPGLPEPFEPSAVLPPFLSTRTWVDLRQGIGNSARLEPLVRAIKGIAQGPVAESSHAEGPPPYRGLDRFEEEHADLFFGRAPDVQRLLEKLKVSRFLAVVAPSGCGKSSLVRAGLLPAIRAGELSDSETWAVRVMTPGASPLDALSTWVAQLCGGDDRLAAVRNTLTQLREDRQALHHAVGLALDDSPETARAVLVVDQLEEVFTRCRDEADRAQFLANLVYAATAPSGRCIVIVTLRADFYARCADYPDLALLMAAQQYLLSPMSRESLREVIEEPARRVGVEFEDGLVATILDDAGQQPGTLPLLEYALLEVWHLRRARVVTLGVYQEVGGVAGALARRAEAVYADLDPAQQQLARRILLNLVEPGDGTADTRRRATMRELRALSQTVGRADADEVVDALARGRLVTTSNGERRGQESVEVAHEALIGHWPRLKTWIDEGREQLLLHSRISHAVAEWQAHNADSSYLFRGVRLRELEVHVQAEPNEWSDDDRAFAAASRAQEHADARVRSMGSLGEIAGAAVGTGLAYGVAFGVLAFGGILSLDLALTTAVAFFLLMFAANLFTGLCIAVALRCWRQHRVRRVILAGLAGAGPSLVAYLVFWVLFVGHQLGWPQIAAGLCSGAGLGVGAAIARSRPERLITLAGGGVLGVLVFAWIGGLGSLSWIHIVAAAVALGGLTALAFHATSAQEADAAVQT